MYNVRVQLKPCCYPLYAARYAACRVVIWALNVFSLLRMLAAFDDPALNAHAAHNKQEVWLEYARGVIGKYSHS